MICGNSNEISYSAYGAMQNLTFGAIFGRRLAIVLATVFPISCAPVESIHGESPSLLAEHQTVDYSIIVTGSELLTGVYADSHTLFLTKTLRPLGLHCVGSVSVDDREKDIREALEFTLKRSQLVIVTGGLGPTESDITRDVLSAYCGLPLREHPEVLQEMERRLDTPRAQLRPNLRRQTRVPLHGSFLPNAAGTAVGLVFEHGEKVIIALPGPPRELQPMVREHLIPYLAKTFGVHTMGSSLAVRFVGLGQSQIDQTMQDHVPLPADVMQTSQFAAGRVDFTFSVPGNTPADQQRLKQLGRDLQKYMGDHIYAFDSTTTLEEAAARQFELRRQRVVLSEMGSGGMLAAGFCQTPSGRKVLAGAFVAAGLSQMRHVLNISADAWANADATSQLDLLATAAIARTRGDWAIVVGPPEPVDDSSQPQVHVLIRTPAGKLVQRSWPWNGSSPASLSKLSTQLFDFLRQEAKGPRQEAKGRK